MTGSGITGPSVLIDREARRVSGRIADSLEEQAKTLIAAGYLPCDLQTVYRQGGEYPPVVVPKWIMEAVGGSGNEGFSATRRP